MDDNLKNVMQLLFCTIFKLYLRFSTPKDMFHYQLQFLREYTAEYTIRKKVLLKPQKIFRLGYG